MALIHKRQIVFGQLYLSKSHLIWHLIISMSSCSLGFWPMDLSTMPSSSWVMLWSPSWRLSSNESSGLSGISQSEASNYHVKQVEDGPPLLQLVRVKSSHGEEDPFTLRTAHLLGPSSGSYFGYIDFRKKVSILLNILNHDIYYSFWITEKNLAFKLSNLSYFSFIIKQPGEWVHLILTLKSGLLIIKQDQHDQ